MWTSIACGTAREEGRGAHRAVVHGAAVTRTRFPRVAGRGSAQDASYQQSGRGWAMLDKEAVRAANPIRDVLARYGIVPDEHKEADRL